MRNKKNKTKGGYLFRAPFVAILICLLFFVEVFSLVSHSKVVASADNDVAYYKQEIEEKIDKQNIVMGDIYDRNGTALLTFSDPISKGSGTYLDPYLYSQSLGFCRETDANRMLKIYNGLLRSTPSDKDQKGYSLNLTLDHELQKKAYEVLSNMIGKKGRGSMVVMNADTGEILAMVDMPTYDASNYDQEAIWMNNAETSNGVNYPLTRVGNDTAPGSTFKLISSLVMLENGLEDFTTEDDTSYKGKGYTINNYKSYTSMGTIGLKDGLRKSSNVYFVKALAGMDGIEDLLTEKAKALYLGEELSLDFGKVYSSWTFDEDTWAAIEKKQSFNPEYEKAASLFGQSEIRMSSVQGAMLAAGIINGGKIMTPYMVASASDSTGKIIDIHKLVKEVNKGAKLASSSDTAKTLKNVENQYVSSAEIPEADGEPGKTLSTLTDKKHAKKLLELMQYAAITQYGFDESLHVAAKSGTSETGETAESGNNAWMVSACNIKGTNYSICINWAKARSGIAGSDMKNPVESVYKYLMSR